MSLTYDGIIHRSLEEQVRYDAEQVQALKQADVTINENLQTVNNELNSKLTKPANPTAESAVVIGTDGTVSTKTFNEIVSPVVDKPYELIEEITITEDMAYTQSNRDIIISRTSEPNGTQYNFKKLFVEIYYGNIQSADIDTTLDYGGNIYVENTGQRNIGLHANHKIMTNDIKSSGDYYNFWVENGRGNARGDFWASYSLSEPMELINNTLLSPLDKITRFTFYAKLPKGAIMYIYGVEA